jgi:hypothetical protein
LAKIHKAVWQTSADRSRLAATPLERDGFRFESSSRSRSLVEHDLFAKPVSTFPDHALAFGL